MEVIFNEDEATLVFTRRERAYLILALVRLSTDLKRQGSTEDLEVCQSLTRRANECNPLWSSFYVESSIPKKPAMSETATNVDSTRRRNRGN